MRFCVNSEFASAQLRGEHIAAALGVPCGFQDIGQARGDKIVFVKDADRGLVLDAKERGNTVIYDPLDLYCYKERQVPFADLVDVMIVPNEACRAFYQQTFKRARFVVIPHQWDSRLVGTAAQDRIRTAYIGKGFNCPPDWRGYRVVESAQMLMAAPQFNLHLSLNQRTPEQILLKPATKIATAAGVLANVVAYPDPSAIELLGTDYPYLVQGDAIEMVREAVESFGSARWKRARDVMRAIRERTSLKAIAALYARLADNEIAEAA